MVNQMHNEQLARIEEVLKHCGFDVQPVKKLIVSALAHGMSNEKILESFKKALASVSEKR